MTYHNKTSDRAIEAARKSAHAMRLRATGRYTLGEIAKEVGYKTASGADAAIQRGLAKTYAEGAVELRLVEMARMEQLHAAFWQKAIDGDCAACDRVIKIAERRAKLMGLDKLADGWMSPQDTQTALHIMSHIMTKYVPEGKRSQMLAEVGAVLKMGRTKAIEVDSVGDTSAE